MGRGCAELLGEDNDLECPVPLGDDGERGVVLMMGELLPVGEFTLALKDLLSMVPSNSPSYAPGPAAVHGLESITTSSRNIPEAQVLLLRGLTGRGAPFFRSTRKVVKAGYEPGPGP